jgi:hypothetical protein
MIALCGILSANVCQNVTPDLYDAAVAYERNMSAFASVLPPGASKPDVIKIEGVLKIIKSMEAKCKNMVDHKAPSVADAKKALETVVANDLLLQKSGPFSEPGLVAAQKGAVDASTKLMALLSAFPQPAVVKASPSPSKDNNDDEEDDEDDEDDEGDDGEEEDDDDDEGDDDDDEGDE